MLLFAFRYSAVECKYCVTAAHNQLARPQKDISTNTIPPQRRIRRPREHYFTFVPASKMTKLYLLYALLPDDRWCLNHMSILPSYITTVWLAAGYSIYSSTIRQLQIPGEKKMSFSDSLISPWRCFESIVLGHGHANTT